METYNFSQIKDIVIPDNYIIVRFNGLFGDVLHGTCKFNHFRKLYPNNKWIIIHEYGNKERAELCKPFFQHLFNSGELKYYFFNKFMGSSRISRSMRTIINSIGVPDHKICDCYVFQAKPKMITRPDIGIEIPDHKDQTKAVIFRKSGWHGHFPERNRPIEEWMQIERYLLDSGYTVYLLGYDDEMPNPNNLIDLRKKMSVYEILDFVKDSSICITTTTFLYMWTQFVCPSLVLSAKGDIRNLQRHWKITNYMVPIDVQKNNYLGALYNYIDIAKRGAFNNLKMVYNPINQQIKHRKKPTAITPRR